MPMPKNGKKDSLSIDVISKKNRRYEKYVCSFNPKIFIKSYKERKYQLYQFFKSKFYVQLSYIYFKLILRCSTIL